MHQPDPRRDARLTACADVAVRLSLLSDDRLRGAVAAAEPLGTGIGGRAAALEVGGRRVFVKRVPLTEVEVQPRNLRSTANLFGLPLFYQYGIGSSGFGAWRELAAHVMTTAWVLAGEYADFPLLYHWRVLPDSPPQGFADAFGGVAGAVAHWDGSPAVRARLEAIGRAPASLVLFLEYVPQTLAAWLGDRREDGTAAAHDPWVAQALERGTDFMRSRGFVHFDAHPLNILTDGAQVYFADFGLALSSGFDLSPEESAFLADHRLYDRGHSLGMLLHHHLLEGLRGDTAPARFLGAWAAGLRPPGVPAGTAAILDRNAGAAVVLGGFHRRLLDESKQTPYPAAEVERALINGASAV